MFPLVQGGEEVFRELFFLLSLRSDHSTTKIVRSSVKLLHLGASV